MAYSEDLAERVRDILADRTDVAEVRMFGGLVFMVNTHMACGIVKDDLMLRLGEDKVAEAQVRGAKPMEMTGRPMKGMVIVAASEVAAEARLGQWVEEAVEVAVARSPKERKG
jgi:TfoX/Sxy family transcriptional regulator of competence genes